MTAAALWVLLGLFVGRVVGQGLLAADLMQSGGPVPAWEEWYSGLLPYPWLLASQLAIVVACAKASLDVTRGEGYFARSHPELGRSLIALAVVYALAMAVRYALRGSLSIPIVFHWVLAAFLLVLGAHVRRPQPLLASSL